MGCQTIVRYLEGLEAGSRVGGAVYVAGFFDSLTLGEDEEESVWRAWKDTPVNLDHVLARCPKSIAVFSDDDPYVPLSNQDDFRDKLGSEIIVQHAMSHFSRRLELPVALESVLKLAEA
jgi:predicted alpha/beta hydrolase family esterase